MSINELKEQYTKRYQKVLRPTAEKLEAYIYELLADTKRIDRVSVRAKTVKSFINKSQKKNDTELKYSDPLNQIQDQIGARIICFYLDDVKALDEFVSKYFRPIEVKSHVPDDNFTFGYFGKHYILFTPDDVIDDEIEIKPTYFELQIKTLFQHAWSEANHDLQYKANDELDNDSLRKIAYTSAQSWGADKMFQELFNSFEKE